MGLNSGIDRTRGLNENLAREILELHTLGVRTNYKSPSTFPAPQKSGLFARGTSASCPGYHWMFSAQACSSHSLGLMR